MRAKTYMYAALPCGAVWSLVYNHMRLVARRAYPLKCMSGFSLTSDDHLPAAPPTEGKALDASAGRLVGRTTMGSGAS